MKARNIEPGDYVTWYRHSLGEDCLVFESVLDAFYHFSGDQVSEKVRVRLVGYSGKVVFLDPDEEVEIIRAIPRNWNEHPGS